MKKLFLLISILVLLTGCYDFRIHGTYIMVLQKVETSGVEKELFANSKTTNIVDYDKSKSIYEDDFIKIIWEPSFYVFNILLTNKSEHSIKIIWNDAIYVDENGNSERVAHAAEKYIRVEDSQQPTNVLKKLTIKDQIQPNENIHYDENNGWTSQPLLTENFGDTPEELKRIKDTFKGKIIRISLPIQTYETTIEYLFEFVVKDFVPGHQEKYQSSD